MIIEKAYAKINLLLNVLHKRADGYHEVDMIMQTISLHDELRLQKINSGIVLQVANAKLPADDSNLAYKAAQLFLNETKVNCGVEIELLKNIPMEAGLAGGSADAAAVLRGLNKLLQTGLTLQQMQAMSSKIGSDVAFCVAGGTARAVGRGEIIVAASAMPDCILVVFKPDFGIATAWAYGQFAQQSETIIHPGMDAMLSALKTKKIARVAECLGNVLETVSVEKYPLIDEIKRCLRASGALNALMSGSGTAVFGIFEDRKIAQMAKANLESNFSGTAYVCDVQKSYL